MDPASQAVLLDRASRALQVEDPTLQPVAVDGYESAVQVTQIFSGIFFAGLAVWLSFTNGTKLAFIQQASLEKRLTVCCFLGVYVGSVSAFFNFFQLTEVDDILLERPESFVLDFSRPLEWILTCPLMQLVLVLMGGSRIPEYRRVLMPGLSVAVLLCGLTSMLVSGIYVFVAYGVGVCIASVMFFLNRVQIIEHSDGQEGLLSGDSDFRRASMLLIATWVPFPMFYACSTEGLGLITDVVFIQVGWAFLNIVSKFTFIFYIQRIKDNYCSRMKAKRELAGPHTAMPTVTAKGADGSTTPIANKKLEKQQSEMSALIVETMNFLGMAQNSDRFLRLLAHSSIVTLAQLEGLSQADCQAKQLPVDLVGAMQKRLKVWRLEMQDHAELALEIGEAHYQVMDEDPMLKMAIPGTVNTGAGGGTSPPPTSTTLPSGPSPQPQLRVDDERLQRIEEALMALQHQNDVQAQIMRRMCEEGSPANMVDVIQQTVETTVQAVMRSQEGGLQQRLGESTGELVERAKGRLEQVADRVSEGLQAQAREMQASSVSVMNSIDEKLQVALQDMARTNGDATTLAEELRAALRTEREKSEELGRSVGRKLEDHSTRIMEKQERLTETLRSAMQHDITTVISRSDMVGDLVKESGLVVKETLGDIRRLCMTVLDASNAGQDLCTQNLQRLADVRHMLEAISAQIAERDRGGDRDDRGSDPPSRPVSATVRDRDRDGHGGGRRQDRYHGRAMLGS